MLVYLVAILSIFQLFGIINGHLLYFVAIWYIFPSFGMLCQEKSGNPGFEPFCRLQLNIPTTSPAGQHAQEWAVEEGQCDPAVGSNPAGVQGFGS
jgi:disulfide bond formation protein DsbB